MEPGNKFMFDSGINENTVYVCNKTLNNSYDFQLFQLALLNYSYMLYNFPIKRHKVLQIIFIVSFL